MIQKFKTIQGNLKEVEEFEDGSWINVVNPTNGELEDLSHRLNVPLDFLMDTLDIDETARIEAEDGCTLIILRVPRFEGEDINIAFTTQPLGIIFTGRAFITVCSKETDIISDFVAGRVKKFFSENRSRFLLQIFVRTASLYLRYLKDIYKRTTAIESELHKAMKNKELIKLLNFEKSLVFFTTSLKSNELMMERLQKMGIIKMNPDDEDLLEDVIIENKQAIEMSNIYSNILGGMMDAFASVISNNLNVVMKFLTMVTVILMIPTLIASIYGMNIKLPLQNLPHIFLVTVGFSLILLIIFAWIFVKKKWI